MEPPTAAPFAQPCSIYHPDAVLKHFTISCFFLHTSIYIPSHWLLCVPYTLPELCALQNTFPTSSCCPCSSRNKPWGPAVGLWFLCQANVAVGRPWGQILLRFLCCPTKRDAPISWSRMPTHACSCLERTWLIIPHWIARQQLVELALSSAGFIQGHSRGIAPSHAIATMFIPHASVHFSIHFPAQESPVPMLHTNMLLPTPCIQLKASSLIALVLPVQSKETWLMAREMQGMQHGIVIILMATCRWN